MNDAKQEGRMARSTSAPLSPQDARTVHLLIAYCLTASPTGNHFRLLREARNLTDAVLKNAQLQRNSSTKKSKNIFRGGKSDATSVRHRREIYANVLGNHSHTCITSPEGIHRECRLTPAHTASKHRTTHISTRTGTSASNKQTNSHSYSYYTLTSSTKLKSRRNKWP